MQSFLHHTSLVYDIYLAYRAYVQTIRLTKKKPTKIFRSLSALCYLRPYRGILPQITDSKRQNAFVMLLRGMFVASRGNKISIMISKYLPPSLVAGFLKKSPGISRRPRIHTRAPLGPPRRDKAGPHDSSRVRHGLDNAARINTLHISPL